MTTSLPEDHRFNIKLTYHNVHIGDVSIKDPKHERNRFFCDLSMFKLYIIDNLRLMIGRYDPITDYHLRYFFYVTHNIHPHNHRLHAGALSYKLTFGMDITFDGRVKPFFLNDDTSFDLFYRFWNEYICDYSNNSISLNLKTPVLTVSYSELSNPPPGIDPAWIVSVPHVPRLS